jgi:hypothetical protein
VGGVGKIVLAAHAGHCLRDDFCKLTLPSARRPEKW